MSLLRSRPVSTLSLALALSLPLVGCGDGDGGSTATDDGGEDGPTEDGDGDVDGSDEDDQPSPDDETEQPDAGPSEDDGGPGPDPNDPLASTEPTNTPGAEIVYVGEQADPGLVFLGSHIELEDAGGDLDVRWYARVRNDFTQTLCAFGIEASFKDAAGAELLLVDFAQTDLRPHLREDGSTNDCAGPGEVFYLEDWDVIAAGLPQFTLADVARIEWKFSLGGYLIDYPLAQYASLDDLEVGVGAFGDYVVKGTFSNDTAMPLEYPSIAAYLLNAGGQPVARFYDISGDPVAAHGTWSFEAGGADAAFPLDKLDFVVNYSVF